MWSKKFSISRHLADSFHTLNLVSSTPIDDQLKTISSNNHRYSRFDDNSTINHTPLSIVNESWNDNNTKSIQIIDEQPNTNLDPIIVNQPDKNLNNMENNNSYVNRQTEYSHQFRWKLPMIETKPLKQEPMMSQYQLSFGQQHPTSYSQPNSLTNSYNNNNKHDDVIYSASGDHIRPQTSFALSFRDAAVPGNAVLNMAIVEPEILKKSSSTTTTATISSQNSQQHQQQQSAIISTRSQPQSPTCDDPTKSEYHAKFKDFNEYVYVEGDGFKKGDRLSLKAQQMAQSWFSEVTERSRQACKYRARSRNGAQPVNPEYSWNGVQVKDRNDLAALALATRLVIEQKRSERNSSQNTSRSASAKPHLRQSTMMMMNSAPPSLQDDRSISSSKPRPVTRKLVTKPNTTAASSTTKQTNVDRINNNNNSKVVSSKIISVKKPPPPPSSSTTTATNQQTSSSTAVDGSKKIWIKPVKKPQQQTNESAAESTSIKTKPANTGSAVATTATEPQQQQQQREFDPQPKQVPLHTTQIKSPEQISGIKSPSPESWKVTIEKGGLNWVNGGQTTTPANFPDTQSLLQQQQQQNDQMVRPVPINGISGV